MIRNAEMTMCDHDVGIEIWQWRWHPSTTSSIKWWQWTDVVNESETNTMKQQSMTEGFINHNDSKLFVWLSNLHNWINWTKIIYFKPQIKFHFCLMWILLFLNFHKKKKRNPKTIVFKKLLKINGQWIINGHWIIQYLRLLTSGGLNNILVSGSLQCWAFFK